MTGARERARFRDRNERRPELMQGAVDSDEVCITPVRLFLRTLEDAIEHTPRRFARYFTKDFAHAARR